jgi:hypothetical protein
VVAAKTAELGEKLLRRNAYALALTKRVLNKQALASFNFPRRRARLRVPQFLHADSAGKGARPVARERSL